MAPKAKVNATVKFTSCKHKLNEEEQNENVLITLYIYIYTHTHTHTHTHMHSYILSCQWDI